MRSVQVVCKDARSAAQTDRPGRQPPHAAQQARERRSAHPLVRGQTPLPRCFKSEKKYCCPFHLRDTFPSWWRPRLSRPTNWQTGTRCTDPGANSLAMETREPTDRQTLGECCCRNHMGRGMHQGGCLLRTRRLFPTPAAGDET
jgi:hypothetical protein